LLNLFKKLNGIVMNFLKTAFIIAPAFFFLSVSSFSQTGWVAQSSGTSEHLHSVYFFDALTGWVVGDAGKILKTTNGGTNWIPETSPSTGDLLSVYFVTSLSGWAVGSSGDIIATGNGGTTWVLQSTGSTSALNSVFFMSALTGWAVGEFLTILKTTNGGTNWLSLLSGSVSLKSVVFTTLTTGYISGSGGYVSKTTNGGTNWTVYNSNVSYDLYSIHFPNSGASTTGYTVGMGSPSPPILKSTNSGVNWTIQPVPLGNALTSVYFADLSTGWAAGWIGSIMHTTSGGANWTDQLSGTSNSLRSIYFANSLTGWAVGDAGTILKTGNGGVTGVEIISSNVPEQLSLSQNYPNPFNPSTSIRFSIPSVGNGRDRSLVKLIIYDILGREVAVLVDEQLAPGTYEVNWSASGGASNFSSGVYYYTLKSGDFSQTKKMLLIK
jgi:photosystem II stability/assembly factor-like uncharacterized protein